ncbi:MAG TPA: hypothetical protein VFP23_00355 [Solirubrobacterales bacterium]|nr:hypothetical protein [Solirubrobacterales bacterium]
MARIAPAAATPASRCRRSPPRRTSNRTFYAEFKDKWEAFLAAFDALAERALRRAGGAFAGQRRWSGAVGAAIFALLSFLAADPLFARLAFFELAAAGPAGLDHADRAAQSFIAILSPAALPAGVEPVPEVVVEAIGAASGRWSSTRSAKGAPRRCPPWRRSWST